MTNRSMTNGEYHGTMSRVAVFVLIAAAVSGCSRPSSPVPMRPIPADQASYGNVGAFVVTHLLLDLSADFERRVLDRMRATSATTEESGYRSLNGQDVFFVARPLRVANQGCLRCHSTPEAAPQSMIAVYGRDHGFGWQVGEIVTAQFTYVPASNVFDDARRSWLLMMAIFVGLFGVVFGGVMIARAM